MERIVSVFENTTSTLAMINASEEVILNAIKDGKWKERIEKLRALQEDEYKKEKVNLPGVTFSGSFTKRLASEIEGYSQLIVLDIDDIELAFINNLKQSFVQDKFIYAAFISPSNSGLKILVKLDCTKQYHIHAFESLKKYFEDIYGVFVDKSGKDLSRLCFISYDPDLYWNQNSEPWKVDTSIQIKNSVHVRPNEKFVGKKVSNDVQYIFNVCVKWTERSFTFGPGSINNYIHCLACTLNRCGITANDAYFLIDNNYITPDKKWTQSIKSAYFHNKHEHNTITVYQLENEAKNVPQVEEEKEYSEDKAESDIISKTILLLNKSVLVPSIKDIIREYAYSYHHKGYIDINEERLDSIFAKAYEAHSESKKTLSPQDGVLGASLAGDMLHSIINNFDPNGSMTTTFEEFDAIMGGGLRRGNMYPLIGRENTFKSILVQYICAENAKLGIPSLYLNGEMSSSQFFERLINKEMGINLSEEIKSGRMNAQTVNGYVEAMNHKLKDNLYCYTGSGFSESQIISTVEDIRQKSGKDLGLIIVDGISKMEDVKGNEIISGIHNAAICKEIAKKLNVAVIPLFHLSGATSKHYRHTADHVRGGLKVLAEADGFFCTSLLIDPSCMNVANDDIQYYGDKLHLRYVDKRGTGETMSKILSVSKPMKLEALALDPNMFEIKTN